MFTKVKIWRAKNEKKTIEEYGEKVVGTHTNLISVDDIVEIPKNQYKMIKEFDVDLNKILPHYTGRYYLLPDEVSALSTYIDEHFFTYTNPNKVSENYHDTYKGITQTRAIFYPDIMEVITNLGDGDPVFNSSRFYMILEVECHEVLMV